MRGEISSTPQHRCLNAIQPSSCTVERMLVSSSFCYPFHHLISQVKTSKQKKKKNIVFKHQLAEGGNIKSAMVNRQKSEKQKILYTMRKTFIFNQQHLHPSNPIHQLPFRFFPPCIFFRPALIGANPTLMSKRPPSSQSLAYKYFLGLPCLLLL